MRPTLLSDPLSAQAASFAWQSSSERRVVACTPQCRRDQSELSQERIRCRVLRFGEKRSVAFRTPLRRRRKGREDREEAVTKEQTLNIVDGCSLRLREARAENESEGEERSKRSFGRKRSVDSL